MVVLVLELIAVALVQAAVVVLVVLVLTILLPIEAAMGAQVQPHLLLVHQPPTQVVALVVEPNMEPHFLEAQVAAVVLTQQELQTQAVVEVVKILLAVHMLAVLEL
jgi:hypothetical protein